MSFIDLSKGKNGIIKCTGKFNMCLYESNYGYLIRKNDIMRIENQNASLRIYFLDKSCKNSLSNIIIYFNDDESKDKWLEKYIEGEGKEDRLIEIEKRMDDIENMIKYQPGGMAYTVAKEDFEKYSYKKIE